MYRVSPNPFYVQRSFRKYSIEMLLQQPSPVELLFDRRKYDFYCYPCTQSNGSSFHLDMLWCPWLIKRRFIPSATQHSTLLPALYKPEPRTQYDLIYSIRNSKQSTMQHLPHQASRTPPCVRVTQLGVQQAENPLALEFTVAHRKAQPESEISWVTW